MGNEADCCICRKRMLLASRQVFWACIAVLALSCAGSRASLQPTAQPKWPDLPFPDMTQARAASAVPPERLGDEFCNLIEPQNVGDGITVGRFTPAWTEPASGTAGLAYALYELDCSDVTSYAEVRLLWDPAETPTASNLWIALADWPAGVWRWYQTSDSETLPYDAARHEQDGRLLALVALTGNGESLLRSISIGWRSEWVHSWGNYAYDQADGVAVDSAGNIYLAGGSYDWAERAHLSVWKYNASGLLQWSTHYSCTDSESLDCIALDQDGNIIAAGITRGQDGSLYDVLLLKYSPDGTLLMQKAWGTITDAPSDDADALAVDGDGNIYVCGQSEGPDASYYYLLLLKFAPDLSLIWSRRWGMGDEDFGDDLGIDASGNVYIAGTTQSWTYGGCLLVKFDPSGTVQWAREWDIGPEWDFFYGICVTPEGTSYCCGNSYNLGDHSDLVLTSFSADGTQLWSTGWHHYLYDESDAIVLGTDGNLHLTAGIFTEDCYNDVLHLIFSTAGEFIASTAWCNVGPESHDIGAALANHPDGSLVFAGQSLNADGDWRELSGTVKEANGQLFDRTMPAEEVGGTLHDLIGLEYQYDGVRDIGYSATEGHDMLVIKTAPPDG